MRLLRTRWEVEDRMQQRYRPLKESILEISGNIIHHLRFDANSIITIILCLILFFQFCSLTYSISLNTESWPIVNANDNDGANAIRVSENSFWLKNNGFYPYGNLYFNLAQTVALFDPFSAGPHLDMQSSSSDKGHHFALMFVSLCSLYGMAYVIASALARSTAYRLLSVVVLVGVFIKNTDWTTWIFRPHPDMLFSFLLALALYLTFHFMRTGRDSFYYASSVVWGLALATKLTATFFMPTLVILFLPPVTRTNILKSFRYYATIAISYLLVGFPQNFVFWKHLSFLKIQSNLSVTPTAASVTEMVLALLNQSIPLLAAIIILRLVSGFFDERETDTAVRPLIFAKAGGLILFPLASLLSQRILTSHQHYTLPVAGCLLVLAAFLMRPMTKGMPRLVLSPAREKTIVILLILTTVLFFRLSPNAVPSVLAAQTEGRAEARAFVAELARYQRNNLKILVDPYLPWDRNEGPANESFSRTLEDIRPGKADILALSRNYYSRYLEDPPSLYVQKDIPNWKDVCKFYAVFANKDRVVDPYGKTWKKTFTSPRGWEIWKSVE